MSALKPNALAHSTQGAPRPRLSSVDPFAATVPDGEAPHAGLEALAVKTATAIRSITARSRGLRGVFLTLAQQHAQAAALLATLEAQTQPRERAASWSHVRTVLLAHERTENELLVPALGRFGLTRELASQHAQEAGQLEALVAQIQDLAPSDPSFMPKVAELAGWMRQHAEEEENVWFVAAQEVLTEERTEQLDAAFLEAQALIQVEI